MPVSIIASVFPFKDRLFIGHAGDLIAHLKDDLSQFKAKTIGHTVVMGRKTWDSLPASRRPLPGRNNIVITRDMSAIDIETGLQHVKYMTWSDFLKFLVPDKQYWVIGGAEIYRLFMSLAPSSPAYPRDLYITEVYSKTLIQEGDTVFPDLNDGYKLQTVSDEIIEPPYSYRYLHYTASSSHSHQTEKPYLDILRLALSGKPRSDRTGVGTRSVFGAQWRFDISESVPLLTTKRVPWKACIEELLWFLRGDTDARILQRKGVKIWDGNTSRAFLDSRGLQEYEEGILGPGYGWAMRHFGGTYHPRFANSLDLESGLTEKAGGFDQVQYILEELRTNPFSRRIMMSYWNPCDFDKIALLPCHYSCQFYVEEESDGTRYLSCHWTQRSQDVFLGAPFNVFSYAVMTYIIAAKTGMRPRSLICSVGDLHVYQNHIDQVQEQLNRSMRTLPKLILDPSVATKEFDEMTIDDFKIVGYFPHPMIKAPMAV